MWTRRSMPRRGSYLVAFITGVKSSPHVDIVHVDPTLDAQAWQLFKEVISCQA